MTTCPDRGLLEQVLVNRLVDTELDELGKDVECCEVTPFVTVNMTIARTSTPING
jgi:hypothetical protein